MRNNYTLLIGLFISFFFLYILFRNTSVQSIYQISLDLELNYIFLSIFFLVISYLLKSYRWHLMISMIGKKISYLYCIKYYFEGNALNNVIPLRAGDVYRLVRSSKHSNVGLSSSTTIIVFERFLDLLSLIFISILIINLLQLNLPSEIILSLKIITISLFLIISFLIFMPLYGIKIIRLMKNRLPLPDAIFTFISNSLISISDLAYFKNTLILFTLSLVAWIIEAQCFGFFMLSFGMEYNFFACLLICSMGSISTLIPSSPGFFGTFHYFIALSLSLFGYGEDILATYALIAHTVMWSTVIIIGLIIFFTLNEKN